MKPVMIKVLLDYYTGPFGTEVERGGDAIGELLKLKMLEENPRFGDGSLTKQMRYQVSAGGELYCEALQAVPLPVKKWVMPEDAGRIAETTT